MICAVRTNSRRFSQDMELIDMTLPSQAINTYLGRYNLMFKYLLVPELMELIGLSNCCVQLVILCIMGKYLTITVPALGIILFFVQRYYLRTSRQVRLLDIE